MMRRPGTNSRGGQFDALTVAHVWHKAQVVPGYHPPVYRKDSSGAWIARAEYGQPSTYGWEIDHIIPVAAHGMDALTNLQPRRKGNRHKSDTHPSWTCAGTA